MASMTAMFTGLSGLSANSRRLDVIGNNIANVNTTAFKSNRMLFSPSFSRNFSLGSAPNEFSGGRNPGQIGLGTSIAGTQRNFANGAISATGVVTDLAVEGDGFFMVRQGDGVFYTRAGAFQRNANNDLVTATGARVMGFGVDSNFQVMEGQLTPLNIPLGTLTLAEATSNVVFNGNLNASGTVATTGSVHTSRAMYVNANDPPDSPMAGTEDLTVGGNDLYIVSSVGVPTLAIEGGANTIITISGVEKGGQDLGTHTFAFSANPALADVVGSTMNDFTAFLESIFGLDASLGGGVSINGNGEIVVTGNNGEVQDLDVSTASFTATSDTGNGLTQPFVMSRAGTADGESVRTSFVVFDSLGTPLTVDLSFVLDSTTSGSGTSWQFIAESSSNDAVSRIVGLGTVTFDNNGQFVSSSNDTIQLARQNGAISPLTISLQFDNGSDAISSLTDTNSNLAAVFQDGSPIGTLSNFSIGEDGTIAGSFTNGLTRTIGQVAIAKFANPEGLIDVGNNFFTASPNSGEALVTRPGEFGTGRIIGGALELSNVDLSQEFINMILASTGYSASSRIITTTNELIQQLLVIGR